MRLPPAVPKWIDGRLDPEIILRTPHAPPLLLYAGIEEIQHPSIEPLTWTCCSTYRVRVNGGGLLAEQPMEPSPSAPGMPPLVEWRSIETLADWIGDKGPRGFLNPLSVPTSSPIVTNNGLPPQCVDIGGIHVSAASLTPLKPYPEENRCRPPTTTTGSIDVEIGFLSMEPRPGHAEAAQNMKFFEAEGCTGIATSSTLVLLGDCAISFRSPYLEHVVGYLTGAGYTTVRGRKLLLEDVQAGWVRLEGSVALASRRGFSLEVGPGRLVVYVRGSLRLARGGDLAAYRLLLEDSIEWEPMSAPSRGLGHARASGSIAVLHGAGEGFLAYSVVNPTGTPGVLEVRLPFWGEKAVARGPLGETDIPVAGDLFRVPAPPGYVGSVRVDLSRKKLWLLRLSRRRG